MIFIVPDSNQSEFDTRLQSCFKSIVIMVVLQILYLMEEQKYSKYDQYFEIKHSVDVTCRVSTILLN